MIRNIRLVPKSVTSKPATTIVIQILPNISRKKGNQAMKFGQLTEYKIRHIFLEKPYTKCGEETITRPFCRKSKLIISLDQ